MKRILVLLILIASAAAALAEADRDRFQAARNTQKKGEVEAAFQRYLTIPGAEHAAAALARPEPDAYLEALATTKEALPPTAALIKAELHLARGDQPAALKLFRETAGLIAQTNQWEWEEGRAPFNYYYVEPPAPSSNLAEPFQLGPGSHRDNWLIRRFIALDAMDDAEQEFERIWKLYRLAKEPRVQLLPDQDLFNFDSITNKLYLRSPAGYDGRGLQFAVDYAYFLSQRGKQEQALNLLLEPLRAMDMDINADLSTSLTMLSEEAAAHYPQGPLFIPPYRHYSWNRQAVLSRNDFIRLAYGEFKKTDREQELIEALDTQIQSGRLRARRVLARVLLLQNKPNEALEQELTFITEKEFPPFTATYRRGMLFEEHQQPLKAAVEYERLLGLTPVEAVTLPDPEQKNLEIPHPEDWSNPNARWIRMRNTDVVNRLKRIYAAHGETEKLLNLTLKRLAAVPKELDNFNDVQDAAKRFRAAGRTADYTAWANERLAEDLSPVAKANLHWSINERDQTLAALKKCKSANDLAWWKSRFKERERLIELYDQIIALNPADHGIRLTRLLMNNDPWPADTVDDMEILLAPDAPPFSEYGNNHKAHYDLAYRLMRLYEKAGRIDALLALGLRVAEGDKPFIPMGDIDRDDYYFRDPNNGWEGDLRSCLALLIHHADPATMTRLESAWKGLPDFPSKQQLARKQRGGFKISSAPPIPWANLPEGVEALASSENVLSLAADEAYVYSGHPWGIAVYDHEGTPLVRVALGAAATQIEPHRGILWIGSPLGLFRVEPETWNVAHLLMDQDIPQKRRTAYYARPNNRVHSLAADGDTLWIGTSRDIRRLDLTTNEMRVFSSHELGVEARDWNRILVEEKQLWFTGYETSLRHDRETGRWEIVQLGEKPAFVIGDIDGTLWGHVHVGQPLRDRPCTIDRNTLEITPILIRGTSSDTQRCINGPFCYYGTHEGRLVFSTYQHFFSYDAQAGHLIPMDHDTFLTDIESELPAGLRRSEIWRGTDDRWHGRYASSDSITGARIYLDGWTYLTLPNNTRVLGGKRDRSPDYNHAWSDRPYPIDHEPNAPSGGLFFIPPTGEPQRVSSTPAANAIVSDTTFTVTPTPDSQHLWLCGNAGVSVLGRDLTTRENIPCEAGARAGRITSAVAAGNRTYFSLDARGKRGGVMVHDMVSNVFTVLTKADGLTEERVALVELDHGELLAEYREPPKGGGAFAEYQPTSNSFTAPNPPRTSPPDRPWNRRWDEPPPFGYDTVLGGSVVSTSRVDRATLYCGTRGVVITKTGRPAMLETAPLAVRVVLDESTEQRRKAEEMEQNIHPKTMAELKEWLAHPNPFVRGMAFRSIGYCYPNPIQDSEEFPAVAIPHVTHPEPFLRKHALQALSRSTSGTEAIPLFQHALADSAPEIRITATIALCERGVLPARKHLEEVYKFNSGFTVERMLKAIAPIATPEVFALLLEYPPSFTSDNKTEVYPPLGAALVRHPETANLLLNTYYDGPYRTFKRDYVVHVFEFTGTNFLAKLHTALKSPDRVIRSNAARACGAIGDSSSIGPLMQAMDLESGLSQASIVWALGELKAKEALPMLEILYVDIRNDEERARHAGFRSGQVSIALQTQYASMRNIEAVGKEWNELKASAAPKPIRPRETEDLISTKHILDAIGKIDPVAAQPFYRTLASDKRADKRRVAARQLTLAEGHDRTESISVLRALLADHDDETRIIAAVSLLILDEPTAEGYLLDWLKGDDYSMKWGTVNQLGRVKDVEQLRFAPPALVNIIQANEHTALTNNAENLLKRIPKP